MNAWFSPFTVSKDNLSETGGFDQMGPLIRWVRSDIRKNFR